MSRLFPLVILLASSPAAARTFTVFDQRDAANSGTVSAYDHFGSDVAAGDFDCDGQLDSAGSASGDSSVAMEYTSASDGFLWSTYGTLAAGDFNGDGCDDLAVGIPEASVSGVAGAGLVKFYKGTVAGLSLNRTLYYSSAGGTVSNEQYFGYALAVGDYNHDGRDDLAVGAHGADVQAGRVAVFKGNGAGSFVVTTTGAVLYRESSLGGANVAGDTFGGSLAWGDFDNNGYDDLAIGVEGDDYGYTDAGVVRIVPSIGGALTTASAYRVAMSDMGLLPYPFDHLGTQLAAGDFNSDGYDDLAMTVRLADDAGELWVRKGAATGLKGTVTQLDQSDCGGTPEADDLFGDRLVFGDFDGDGDDDLVASAPAEQVGGAAENGGWVAWFDGGVGLTCGGSFYQTSFPAPDNTPVRYDSLGSSLSVGDKDGDGLDDLLVGMPGMTSGGVAVWVTDL
jgi:hypothetical protein